MPTKRALWTEQRLVEAMEAVRNGMAVRTASSRFGIPRRTLRNHINSGSTTKKIGRPCMLTVEQENDLRDRIAKLADIGMPVTYKGLRRSVFAYVQKMGISHNFSRDRALAGRKWVRLFLKRHPDISMRKAQHMNAARAAKLNRFIVQDYFKKLRDVMIKSAITDKPQSIFNMDEKGCRLNLHKQQVVLAKKGSKRVHMIAEEHAENVTIVACGNALGQAIPPMILMKGIRQKPEWSMHLPPGSVIEMTAKGSMTTQTFVKWIDHFSKFKPAGKVLLIFDGASSHLDYTIVEAAEKNDIILFCLPSNTTHELQPMDKAVFAAFESYWDEEVLLFWTNKPNHTVNKTSFGLIFSKVWPKAASPNNIMAGFRATGIYPYDPNIIPDTAFGPSEISARRTVENGNAKNVDPEENTATQRTPIQNNVCNLFTATKKIVETKTDFRDEASIRDLSRNKPKSQISCSSSVLSDRGINQSQPGPSGLCRSKRKERRSSSSSDNGDYSLHNTSSSEGEESFSDKSEEILKDRNGSFKEILPTPDMEEKKFTPRRKSLNYRAQRVTKELFQEQQKKASKTEKNKKVVKTKKVVEKWYCYLCDQDKVLDMRLCSMCLRYVHEECVGLTKEDKELAFLCPSCS